MIGGTDNCTTSTISNTNMALSSHRSGWNRAQSVQEIVQEAEKFDFSTRRSLQAWLRSAQMLLAEAKNNENDGNLQMAYLYLYRHAQLVYSKIPLHPEFKDPAFKKDISAAQKSVKINLEKLEHWKPRINQDHRRYVDAVERRNADRKRVRSERESNVSYATEDIDLDGGRQWINASEHRQLAVDLGQREIRRRREGGQTGPSPRVLTHTYHYPTVPAKESKIEWRVPTLATDQTPPIPSKSSFPPSTTTKIQSAPAPPPKTKDAASPPPSPAAQYTFQPSAFTESGSPLRTVLLPPDLRTAFLNVAHPNTARNLETCGILCGTAIHGALFISHVVIPAQTSTSDTCDTTEAGDNSLFDYCDGRDLLVCGWIHTHPSQSCFMSSRDLHTSSGYQIMLPEAIAIVCAPRHNPDWGIFRLTDPPGLGAVLDCTQPGIFHPHAETNLYTDALRPGHVVEGSGLKFEIVDLRK